MVERSSTDIIRIDRVGLGAAALEQVVGASYDELDVDGVLGFNAFRGLTFTMDFPGRRLTLGLAPLPAPDGQTLLAYRLEGRMPYVAVDLDGKELWFNLDTGAADEESWRRINDLPSALTLAVGTVGSERTVELPAVELGR